MDVCQRQCHILVTLCLEEVSTECCLVSSEEFHVQILEMDDESSPSTPSNSININKV